MAVDKQYMADVEEILSHRGDNGGDLWTTPDKRLLKGAPFSTLESVLYLLELGMEPGDPVLREAAELIFSTWQKDGRFKVYPREEYIRAKPPTPPRRSAIWDMRRTKGYSRRSGIFYKRNIRTAAGAAINSASAEAPKRNIQTRSRRSPSLTSFDTVST